MLNLDDNFVLTNRDDNFGEMGEMGQELKAFFDKHPLPERQILIKDNGEWKSVKQAVLNMVWKVQEYFEPHILTIDDFTQMVSAKFHYLHPTELQHFLEMLDTKREGVWGEDARLVSFVLYVDGFDIYDRPDNEWDTQFEYQWMNWERSDFNVWRKREGKN